MNEFLQEIQSQPQALLDTLNYIKENQTEFQRLLDVMKTDKISRVIFTGMGSSYFSSYVPYYLLNQKGFLAEMREAGEFLMYSFPNIEDTYFDKTMIILISQSGESGEVVEILKKIKNLENPPFTIGITNSPKSTLALDSNMSFLTKAGVEKSVTSKSYVCTLLLLYILAEIIIEGIFNEEAFKEIEQTIEEVKVFLSNSEKINVFYNNLLSFYGTDINCLELLSRGPSLSTAFQGALNFKEIVKNNSEASPCSTFNHGGIECLDINSKIIIISSEENNFKLNIHFITKMIEEMDFGKILHITNIDSENKILTNSSKVFTFKHDISNPFLSPIIEIIILQLFFYKMAEKLGIVPGKFRFTQKITREI